tara:strand:- start:2625 stop:2900 length:276 start_codon:yes stop_codon:yes gene_type:complete
MEIKNMKIEEGCQNWVVGEMTSGEITIRLPNGTCIDIQASVQGEWNSCNISVHCLNDTEMTIYEKGSSITKRQKKRDGHTWTVIKSKGDEC